MAYIPSVNDTKPEYYVCFIWTRYSSKCKDAFLLIGAKGFVCMYVCLYVCMYV
jgi:hypothetical protein